MLDNYTLLLHEEFLELVYCFKWVCTLVGSPKLIGLYYTWYVKFQGR